MVQCIIRKCKSRSTKNSGIRFFKVPAVIKNQCIKTNTYSAERRLLWIQRIKSINGENVSISNNAFVCSKHFRTGAPAHLFDNLNPDWAPSVFMNRETSEPSENKKDFVQPLEERRGQEDETALMDMAVNDSSSYTNSELGSNQADDCNVQVAIHYHHNCRQESHKPSSENENVKNANVNLLNENALLKMKKGEILIDDASSTITNNSFSKAYERVLNENVMLKEENEKQVHENVLFKLENQKYLNENFVLKQEIASLRNDYVHLQIEKDKVSNENVKLKEENERFRNDNTLLKENYEKAVNDNTILREENKKVKRHNLDLSKNIKMLNLDNIALRDETRKLKKKNCRISTT